MTRFSLTFILLLLAGLSYGQAVQSIKGTVVDQQSEVPIIGATVELLTVTPIEGTTTDLDGRFTLTGVAVGRHSLRISYLGYDAVTIPNLLVTAGKQAVINIGLEEAIVKMDEVVVTARVEKGKPQNEMATVSARSFNLEEVNRFSGGRNDVARLAGSFAGVAVADDSRNDIVIRGNSPTGVLWRLNGIPIPNPNHFSTLGTTGGPVSAINPNLLKTSDFLTSAFPAEYGNALGGVFDLGFRPGNRDEHEFMFQLSAFSGLEAMAEGPMSKDNNSSYLVSYRHSFVQVANELGLPVGTNATPNYRDFSFNFDLANGKAGKFSLFGIGATSDIDFLADEIDENDLFASPNRDSYAQSQMGIVGLRHNIIVGKDAYVRTIVSAATARSGFQQDNFMAENKLRVTEVEDITNTFSVSSFYNRKFSPRFTLRTGLLAERFELDTQVDDRDGRPDLNEDGEPDWVRVRDFKGGMSLLQAFAQGVYRFTDQLSLQTGLHAQYLDINDSYAVEPRMALNWQFAPKHALSAGYGLHHQMQPMPVFFLTEVDPSSGQLLRSNADLDFTRSHHFVLGYDWRLAPSWRLKAETYYQAISQVPVTPFPSSFSMLNAGADFVFPEVGRLINEGTGANYGFELTVEKFFSKGYYGLLTASFFDSKYKGSDGIERNTAFNNGYVVNFLAGKEVKIGKDKRNALTFDTRLSTAGGRYYTPIDLAASQAVGQEVLMEDMAFSERFDPYFRLDVKFGYQLNSKTKRLSQQFFIDFQNVTNHENIFDLRYNPETNEVNRVLQSGFFPDIMYRLQF